MQCTLLHKYYTSHCLVLCVYHRYCAELKTTRLKLLERMEVLILPSHRRVGRLFPQMVMAAHHHLLEMTRFTPPPPPEEATSPVTASPWTLPPSSNCQELLSAC